MDRAACKARSFHQRLADTQISGARRTPGTGGGGDNPGATQCRPVLTIKARILVPCTGHGSPLLRAGAPRQPLPPLPRSLDGWFPVSPLSGAPFTLAHEGKREAVRECVRHRGDLAPLLPLLTLGAWARGAQQASRAWPSATRPETALCGRAD